MKILAIDPGETSGFCIVNSGDLSYSDKDKNLVVYINERKLHDGFDKILEKYNIDLVVYEEFKLYPWKAKQKSWSTFPTVEVIGVLKYIADKNNVDIIGQGADAKEFFDDKKLKWCGLYKGYSPHERDAIRHAFYYLEFGDNDE